MVLMVPVGPILNWLGLATRTVRRAVGTAMALSSAGRLAEYASVVGYGYGSVCSAGSSYYAEYGVGYAGWGVVLVYGYSGSAELLYAGDSGGVGYSVGA